MSFGSCIRDESLYNTDNEVHESEGPQGFIDFETLLTNIGDSPAFNANVKYLDKNRSAPLGSKGVDFVDAYIDTNTISLIETEEVNYYTLKIVNNNPNEKGNVFYNLVFEQNIITGEVTSVIIQYNPELSWLFDKSQGFKGDIIKFDNELISIEDLTGDINLDGELRGSIIPCSISAGWECPNGHSGPGPYGDGTKTCGGSWVITIGPGCGTFSSGGSDGGGGNTGNDGPGGDGSTPGGGGSIPGSGTTQTVVLEICNDYTNEGDSGNSEDCKDQYADYFTPYICEEYVDFPLINSINNWAPGNMGAATALANYLANNFPEDDDDDCAEVDFVEKVIKDSSFKDTDTECIHEKMKSNPNSIYSKMFEHFNGTTGKFLHLKVGDTPSGDWGITRGSDSNAQFYTITTDSDINTNGSNLMKYVTLCHEMIHAYMWSSLEDAGLLIFDQYGIPDPSFDCVDYDIPNLNDISLEDRFVAVICAMDNAQVESGLWSHELFNKNVFEIEDYRQALENFLKNEYDWNSESTILKSLLQQEYGSNWKEKIAEIWSWFGLTKTDGFANWCVVNNYDLIIEDGIPTTQNLILVKSFFLNFGNKNCN